MKEKDDIPIDDVKKVREATGCGMMDCKKALLKNNNDIELAIKYLNELDDDCLFRLVTRIKI